MRQAIKLMLTALVPRRKLLTRGARSSSGDLPRLALTFDDGPHPIHTPALLDTLRDCNLRGTFYVIGKEAAQYPDLVRRIVSEGHEIGNHTWTHGEPDRTSPRDFLDEVRRTDDYIAYLTGTTPLTMRPPKGDLNWRKMSGLWSLNKAIALWNVDPRDYRMKTAEEVSAWCRDYMPHDGDVLLFHDNHAWANKAIRVLHEAKLFEQFECVGVSTMAGIRQANPTGKSALCQ